MLLNLLPVDFSIAKVRLVLSNKKRPWNFLQAVTNGTGDKTNKTNINSTSKKKKKSNVFKKFFWNPFHIFVTSHFFSAF